jgi:hypothetical protein
VSTQGANAFGLFAQSVGNGGGNSTSTSVSFSPGEGDDNESPKDDDKKSSEEEDKTPSGPINISVGLDGGEGGSAGKVVLNAAGQVRTTGSDATAIFAQSVGGGGGNAGDADTSGETVSTFGISVGGDGGAIEDCPTADREVHVLVE